MQNWELWKQVARMRWNGFEWSGERTTKGRKRARKPPKDGQQRILVGEMEVKRRGICEEAKRTIEELESEDLG